MKRCACIVALFAAVSLPAVPVSAQCTSDPAQSEVGGLICVDTTWDFAGSPYVVTPDAGGSILIGCGATLTIEAGVEVRFKTNMGITVGSIPFGAGCLVARGTEASPICFTTNDPHEDPPGTADPGDWARIFFTDDACDAVFDAQGEYESGGILEYVNIEYAGAPGGTVTIDQCSPYISHCNITQNYDRGIDANGSAAPPIRIEYCNISDCNTGGNGACIRLTGGTTHRIEYCNISDCNSGGSGAGIYLSGGTAHRIEYCEIWNCTAGGPYGGGVFLAGGGNHLVTGNFVHNCSTSSTGGWDYRYGGGIYVDAGVTLEGNTVQDNTVTTSSSISEAWGAGICLGPSSDGSTLLANEVTGNTCSAPGGQYGDAYGGGIAVNASGACELTDNVVSGNTSSHWGGGICFRNSGSATLGTNTITGNAGGYGGGIAFRDSASATLSANTITGNSAWGAGGGIRFSGSGGWRLELSTISDNAASGAGGGIYSGSSTNCKLINNMISNNTAGNDGGGVNFNNSGGGGEDAVRDNTISDNTVTGANEHGGGIYLNNSGSKIFRNNIITGNQTTGAGSDGGGIEFIGSAWCTLISNTITGNTCADEGGGFLLWQSSDFTMTETVVKCNHTIAGDTGGIWVGGASPPSQNVTFAGDAVLGTYNTISRNDGCQLTNANPYDATGVNDIDATYVNWCTEDPGLINNLICDFFDNAGWAFVIWFPPAPPGPECCPADLDCDGAVGITDFLLLLANWGPCPDPCPPSCLGDIDSDCEVGIVDFLELLANWGPCP